MLRKVSANNVSNEWKRIIATMEKKDDQKNKRIKCFPSRVEGENGEGGWGEEEGGEGRRWYATSLKMQQNFSSEVLRLIPHPSCAAFDYKTEEV